MWFILGLVCQMEEDFRHCKVGGCGWRWVGVGGGGWMWVGGCVYVNCELNELLSLGGGR